jgi:hypothetical protein
MVGILAAARCVVVSSHLPTTMCSGQREHPAPYAADSRAWLDDDDGDQAAQGAARR